ncbi:hypothetical protein KAR28_04560 [Candidatus Parcubacteria bacterium]|nr:hypothetical protein [Candidatus Parcubacteria bacterium]
MKKLGVIEYITGDVWTGDIGNYSKKGLKEKHIGGCFLEDPNVNRSAGFRPMGGSWENSFLILDVNRYDIPLPKKGCREESTDSLSKSQRKTLRIINEEDVLEKFERKYIGGLVNKFKKFPSRRLACLILKKMAALEERELPNIDVVKEFFNRIPYGCIKFCDLKKGLKKCCIWGM